MACYAPLATGLGFGQLLRSRTNKQTYREHMKQTLTTSEAAHLLMQDENANWSYRGAHALIEHLEQLEDDCGMEIEFDRVAIRCDWSEYGSAIEAAENYGWEWEGDTDADADEKEVTALDWLEQQTTVVQVCESSSIIIQRF